MPPKGIGFTENKKFAAVAERKEGRDVVGIYYAGNDWKMVNSLDVDTADLQDIKWSNGDSTILIWDTPLESRIFIYSVATGDLLYKFEPEIIGLGIKTLTVSPNKYLIAAGMFDGSIILYNNLTNQEIASLQHLSKIDLNQASAKTIYVYQEEANRDNKRSSIGLSYQYVCYQSALETNEQKKQEVIKIPSLSKKDIEAFKSSKTEVVGLAGPPTGVQKIEWSYTSHYMASRCDNMPTTVWIWDMTTLELASVLIHTQPVKSF